MKRVIVLSTSDGYEATYVDGKLHDTGNPLGEGDSRLYFLKLHEAFEEDVRQIIKSDNIAFYELSAMDEVAMDGNWPYLLDEFNVVYKQL